MNTKSKTHRLAIIDKDYCKPDKCNHECKLKCPVVRQGKECVDIEDIARISANLCIGCGICVKACPFNAVQIVNLPSQISKHLLHSYGENSFRLYKIPIPKIGNIYGIIGRNGIGKSTLLKILSGRNEEGKKFLPNFGEYEEIKVSNKTVEGNVRGTELQKYFKALHDNDNPLRVKIKPQNIEKVQRLYGRKKVKVFLKKCTIPESDVTNCDLVEWQDKVIRQLNIKMLFESKISDLSGGEMQRLICGVVLMQDSDIYIFDEFTNYLDVNQRLIVSKLIKGLKRANRYIFIVEHDLSTLDYTADMISIMYGEPAAYGIISLPYTTSEAINMYFSGYIPAENMKFRTTSFNFSDSTQACPQTEEVSTGLNIDYNELNINYGDKYKLKVESGSIFSTTSIVLLMGRNGCGKTTYLNNLNKEFGQIISYKSQYIDTRLWSGTVKELLYININMSMTKSIFMRDVIKPLKISQIYDRKVDELSGGEIQRVAIALCLGTPANIYLIDEPSANLDIEYRVTVAKIIKRFLVHNQKLGFIVEHDIMMGLSIGLELNSKIVVFENTTDKGTMRCYNASTPIDFKDGVNKFLEELNVTFRSDTKFKRPRINKDGSQKDTHQKSIKTYFI